MINDNVETNSPVYYLADEGDGWREGRLVINAARHIRDINFSE